MIDEDTEVAQVQSLELPYLENQQNISCIPPGEYLCERITHRKYGVCYYVNDVPGRSGILIHIGNFAAQRVLAARVKARTAKKVDTLGCIMVGLRFVDLNGDGYLDLQDSTKAMNILRAVLPDSFKLIIR